MVLMCSFRRKDALKSQVIRRRFFLRSRVQINLNKLPKSLTIIGVTNIAEVFYQTAPHRQSKDWSLRFLGISRIIKNIHKQIYNSTPNFHHCQFLSQWISDSYGRWGFCYLHQLQFIIEFLLILYHKLLSFNTSTSQFGQNCQDKCI